MINIFICCTLTVEIAIIFLCFNTFFPPRSNPFSLAYNPAVCHATPHTFPPWARLSYEPQYYFATDEVTLCGKCVAADAQRRCSQTKATYYASFLSLSASSLLFLYFLFRSAAAKMAAKKLSGINATFHCFAAYFVTRGEIAQILLHWHFNCLLTFNAEK